MRTDPTTSASPKPLSLFRLLDPAVIADPYPLYSQLQRESPVLWDPYLHTWVVTRYADVAEVLTKFKANRAADSSKLVGLGMNHLLPLAQVMAHQMLFLDPPQHGRVRGLAAAAFTPHRIALLRNRIQETVDSLIDAKIADGTMDVVGDLAKPLPAIVTALMLGVPTSDHEQLKRWSTDYADVLGAFQHAPHSQDRVLQSVDEMTSYFRDAVRRETDHPTDGLIHALTKTTDGDRLSEDEIVANLILTMLGNQETTTNLIGNGLLTLLRHPRALAELRDDSSVLPSAIEELLRFESPSQHTDRVAPYDTEIGGQRIAAGQSVIAVLAAANRDPARFPEPDRLDLRRTDNKHLAFGWSSHFCFGAPLARIEAHVVFETLLRRLPGIALEPGPITWRPNHAFRCVNSLGVRWST